MILGIFIVFLVLLTLGFAPTREHFLKRSFSDYLLDGVSLGMHFVALPALTVLILFEVFAVLIPQFRGSLEIGWGMALLVHALMDYMWYWNHRLFHSKTPLWNLHKVHHAPEVLDPLKTPRNSLASHFLMVYWWMIGLVLFTAIDPTPFLSIAVVTSIINFWGHSDFDFPEKSLLNRIISLVFITPRDHHWHHSRENSYCNFGTVLNFWDRVHKTLYRDGKYPRTYGFKSKDSALKQIFFPSAE